MCFFTVSSDMNITYPLNGGAPRVNILGRQLQRKAGILLLSAACTTY